MTIFVYAALAIAFLIFVLGFLRKPELRDTCEIVEEKKRYAPCVNNGRWLDLSERIFDTSDVRWLEEELAFPRLAHALRLDRKRLAIRWLEALQTSFDALIRTPEIASGEHHEAGPAEDWRMLWMTLRFKFLVSYALLMVKAFGPYHRLIPSFAWVPFSQGAAKNLRQFELAKPTI
jgi:hypothetical protein